MFKVATCGYTKKNRDLCRFCVLKYVSVYDEQDITACAILEKLYEVIFELNSFCQKNTSRFCIYRFNLNIVMNRN